MKRKLYKNVNLKSGVVLKKGTPALLLPTNDDRICRAIVDGQEYRLWWTSVIRPPSIDTLMAQEMDGVVDSIGGCRVEPDGHDEYGYPSWLLAVGVI